MASEHNNGGWKAVNNFLSRAMGWLPARVALATLAWLGFINLHMARVNLSVIIVAMVKRNTSHTVHAQCHAADNGTLDGAEDDIRRHLSDDITYGDEEDAEFEWDVTTQGLVLGCFYYGYAMTQVVGGRLAEVYGTKWVFGVCVLAGGVGSILSPPAARLHYGALIALRVVQGLIQGASWPSMHACVARWIPPLERPRFIGIVYFASTLSTAVTLPLSGLVIDSYGWAAAFYVTGSLSLAWCLLWFSTMYNSPAEHPRYVYDPPGHPRYVYDPPGHPRYVYDPPEHPRWGMILQNTP
ncbi:sialin-like, partial [Cherax quadricarinatus]|uniref:sialin-like n=1 Tax=Cherax quadricarinatus TaxID=27406 RepID=UPI00387E95B7